MVRMLHSPHAYVNTYCMEPQKTDQLGRDDWIAAAYAAFEEGGIRAVKADPLAKKLNVTRGSFYWHFKNVSDLMQAVLVKWKQDQTDAVIAAIEGAGGTASERLLRLLRLCAEDDGAFEMGIRSLITTDENLAAIVSDADATRMRYLTDLMVEMGKSQAQAEHLSPVVYSAWLGEHSGAVGRTAEDRIKNMEVLFDLVTRY